MNSRSTMDRVADIQSAPGHVVLRIDDLILDGARQRLMRADREIPLTPLSFELLLALARAAPDVVSSDALMQRVWPGLVVSPETLTQRIKVLREALEDDAQTPRYIAGIRGRGYRMVAPVAPVLPAARDSRPDDALVGSSSATSALSPASFVLATRRRFGVAAAGLSLVLTGSVIAYLVADRFGQEHVQTAARSVIVAPPKTIAVLPFADLSSSRDQEYLSDGITEELMSSLAKVAPLRVVSHRSSFAFKGSNEDLRTVGQKLKVETILEGSVRKEGDRVRISAQLVRADDGYSLWAETYDRKLDDVLDIQSAIAREVVAALAPMVLEAKASPTTTATGARLTRHPEAYTAYQRGQYFWKSLNIDGLQNALAEFKRAVELDPDFAEAHASIARMYLLLADRGGGDSAQLRALGRAALDRALKLDPELADVWWLKAKFGERDDAPISGRIDDLERALALSPNDPDIMINLSHYYSGRGRRSESTKMLERAYLADPLWPVSIMSFAGDSFTFAGKRQRYLVLADELERIPGANASAHAMRAHLAVIEGRPADWDRSQAKAVASAPRDISVHQDLAFEYAFAGDFDAALYHARLIKRINPEATLGEHMLAVVLLLSGETVSARSVVEEAMARHPEDRMARLADAWVSYFTGDCARAIDSFLFARPDLGFAESELDVANSGYFYPMFAWCLRAQGNPARAAVFAHALNRAFAPPWQPGTLDGLHARMAAAMGDSAALIRHLDALYKSKSLLTGFVRDEPLMRSYLRDPAVASLLDKLEKRRAEWRSNTTKASTRVLIPPAPGSPS